MNNNTEYSVLSPEEEQKLLIEYRENQDKKSKDKIILSHTGLVVSLIKQYYSDMDEDNYDDVLQEGYLGLMEALEHFDINKNVRFSTYATNWIKGRILKNRKFNKTNNYYEIYNESDEDDFLLDKIEASNDFNPETISEETAISEKLNDILADFNETEKDVLFLRYGLMGNDESSYQEISDQLGIPVKRIQKIEQKIIRKLKDPKIKAQLKKYL